MIPIITLTCHIPGTAWIGISSIGPFIPAMLFPAASARLSFCKVGVNEPSIRLGSTDCDEYSLCIPDSILITDAASWWLSIPPISAALFTLPKGDYRGQLKIKDTQGTVIPTHEFHLKVDPDYTPLYLNNQ